MGTRGRPKTHKDSFKLRLSLRLISEIKTRHPELLKPGTTDFAYGKLTSWLESILWRELRGKPKHAFTDPTQGIADNDASESDD